MEEKGTSLIETAIAIPIVLLIIISIFTLAFASYNRVIITSAAREGAREYAVTGSKTRAGQVIDNTVSLSVTQLAYDVEFTERSDSVEVQVIGKQSVFAPGLGAVFSNGLDNSLSILASARYKKEGW